MTTRFETTDAEAARAMLSSRYGVRRFTAPAERSCLRIGMNQLD